MDGNPIALYFFTFVGHLVFSATEEVSCSLQRVENNLQDVLYSIDTLLKYLLRIKTDEYFEVFYEGIRAEAKLLTNEPVLSRYRKPPARYADCLPTPTLHDTIHDFYHQKYFQVINQIIDLIDARFKQSAFPLLCKVEQFILSAANWKKDGNDSTSVTVNDIHQFLINDIDVERLQRELTMLPDYFSTVNRKKNFGLKKITKISTVCEILNSQQIGKDMFCEYTKLISLYLTIPVTTATAERSFSVMNRVKTYLRCTMTQSRLNHVMIPHIHKEKLDLLDLKIICSSFISKNQNRKAFFGRE